MAESPHDPASRPAPAPVLNAASTPAPAVSAPAPNPTPAALRPSGHPGAPGWLTLRQAARLLGVHEGTLRRWADTGKVASFRTPGGHRRFLRTDLAAFLAEGRAAASLVQLESFTHRVLEEARRDVSTRVATEPWRAYYDEVRAQQRRMSGQRLLGVLIQYAAREHNGEPYLQQARVILREYGREAVQLGMALPDMVRAYLFFRRSMVDAVGRCAQLPLTEDPDGARLLGRVNHFWDELLIAAIEGYTEGRGMLAAAAGHS